jgi:hypothetical protein
MAMLGITALPLLAIAVLLELASSADAQLTCSMPGALTAKFGLGQCQNEYSASMSCTLTSGGTAQGVPGAYQGTWSGNSKVATETFGAGGKKWTRSMSCSKDPWISPLKPCTGGVPSFPAGSPAQPQWFPWPGFPASGYKRVEQALAQTTIEIAEPSSSGQYPPSSVPVRIVVRRPCGLDGDEPELQLTVTAKTAQWGAPTKVGLEQTTALKSWSNQNVATPVQTKVALPVGAWQLVVVAKGITTPSKSFSKTTLRSFTVAGPATLGGPGTLTTPAKPVIPPKSGGSSDGQGGQRRGSP